ncbi:MAG: 50S ribosome-binding GTPase [Candidatus Omnitrophica bacterium]|nr:50S ribosome-binding GTPase [Candidatus Omnitrophota bacterium]
MGAVCPILSTKPPQKYSQPDTASGIASLIVAGNANVGKSVIFQLLTGRYATVSNYPGTTVMVSSGLANIAGKSVRVFDTPGLHSLLATSEDELVARDLLLGHSHCVLQVGDAKNLQRTLALTLELAEAGVCLILDLNMVDEARECRVNIDFEKLQHLLGVPVVATIATQRWGMDRLRSALTKAKPSIASVRYPALFAGP